jgi:Zn-dependent peptidase ImmA (M78 family)
MATSIRALVKPELIRWARETAGRTVDETAKRVNVDVERYQAWESNTDEDAPTINQLRTLAEFFRRPLAVFYLPEVPPAPKVPRDFRRLPGTAATRFSPQLIYQMREAAQRRELALELLDELGDEPIPFEESAKLNESPAAVAQRIRNLCSVALDTQRRWRDQRAGFKAWRQCVESHGVMVFQAPRVEQREARGFSLVENPLPVVVVNSKDSPAGRSFSLFHELAHVMLRQSGVCDFEDAGDQEAARVEVFCNAVAAATLMPRDSFLAEDVVNAHPARPTDWSDDELKELSLRYSVSREAVVRRLLELGRTTNRFYQMKRGQFAAEQRAREEKEKESDSGGGPSPDRAAMSNLGPSFVRLVLSSYHQDHLTLSDVSNVLGVRVKHVSRIEEALRRRAG